MKTLGKFLMRLVGAVVVLVAVLYIFGPYEDAPLDLNFDEAKLADGVEAHFSQAEARFDDITPGTEKRVIWAGAPEAKTPISVVYVHGFSATSEEIRPVPDKVAEALGANLIFTRLQGHGRGSDALAEGTVAGWMGDMAEALAAARAAGERVIVISTSTGGTLVAAAATDPAMMRDVAGVVLVSPNFGINNGAAPMLTWPAARAWLPLLAGETRSFEPLNDQQEKYWTTSYPSAAVFPMAAMVKKVAALDYSAVQVPALFWYAPEDQVVRSDVTDTIAADWGSDRSTPVMVVQPTLGDGDDPSAHVTAGDIISPGQTDIMVQGVLDWAKTLP